MLDIKKIFENPEDAEKKLKTRGHEINIKQLVELDKQRRECIFKAENLRAEQNAMNKKIPVMKKNGEDTTQLFEDMKKLSDEAKTATDSVNAIDEEINQILLYIPNLPSDKVPIDSDESGNVEVRRWGEPRKFGFEPQPHWEIGSKLGILDAATAGKVTGTRFTFYRDMGARLERAIVNYFLDTHTKEHGYMEVFPPFMVHRDSMRGTGQLPKFEEDAFRVQGTEYFLIPTAEVPVTNMYREQILDASELTIKHCAYSACFRAEAGAAGRDTRGLIRQHQFNKVELVKFALPENSYDELETLTHDAEKVLQGLGLPYRVVVLCSGDLGFSSAMTYDIEVWMPSYERYVEISSCSNFEDFQARRAGIKFRREKGGKPEFIHTLNGSGVAVGRTTAAILENFQQADGTVTIPDVLKKYMDAEKIG
ncbi:MAG: serine--tRNA ligase [Clostridiales bacterium]|jgi:seryl-tRNA synthetase|nr:serine--tRNA ligase [Clostridiales bacterium]